MKGVRFTNQGIAQSGFAGQGTALADGHEKDSSDSNNTDPGTQGLSLSKRLLGNMYVAVAVASIDVGIANCTVQPLALGSS